MFTRTQKKTRVYYTDRGGFDVNQPYIDLGIMELVLLDKSDIWIFINKAVTGHIRGADGRWKLDPEANKQVGCYAFESAHSMAKLLQVDMEMKAGKGVVIGGDTNTSFDIKDEAGETLRIGSTKGFQKYAIPQTTIANAMMMSQKLDAEFVVWTAGANKDDDDINSGKIIGPQIIGNAPTGTTPQDFHYTFRMDYAPAKGNDKAKHFLYLGPSADVNSGNATAIGNIRRPLHAPELKQTVIEPASLVQALKLVREDANKAATEVIRKKLAAKGVKV